MTISNNKYYNAQFKKIHYGYNFNNSTIWSLAQFYISNTKDVDIIRNELSSPELSLNLSYHFKKSLIINKKQTNLNNLYLSTSCLINPSYIYDFHRYLSDYKNEYLNFSSLKNFNFLTKWPKPKLFYLNNNIYHYKKYFQLNSLSLSTQKFDLLKLPFFLSVKKLSSPLFLVTSLLQMTYYKSLINLKLILIYKKKL